MTVGGPASGWKNNHQDSAAGQSAGGGEIADFAPAHGCFIYSPAISMIFFSR